MTQFFDFVRECEKLAMINREQIILIFEGLFESSARSQLEENFDIFSSQIKKYGLKDANSWGDLNIDYFCIRMCKNIMNRLRPCWDPQLRGKIYVLLSSVLPLNHQSGLNVTGRFNEQKDITTIQTLEEINDELQKQEMESGRNREDVDHSQGRQVTVQEYQVYKNFWLIQKVLAQPR